MPHRPVKLRLVLSVSAAAVTLVASCVRHPTPDSHDAIAAPFRDVAPSLGIQFTYDNDLSDRLRFIETTGGGCGFIDFDQDGRLDVIAVQGGPAPGSGPRTRPSSALFRNLGGQFVNVTREVGLDLDIGYAQGVSVADYNNDDWPDLLITTYGGPKLFRNNHGRFDDVTTLSGLDLPGEPHWCLSAVWADYDLDGYLDLVVTGYASWFPDAERTCYGHAGQPIVCQPTQYAPDQCFLFQNVKGSSFVNVSRKAGLDKLRGRSMGAAWLPTRPGRPPLLFIANDMTANWLLNPTPKGTWTELGMAASVALGPDGYPLSGMGVAAGDLTGDGEEDLVVTNYARQPRSYFQRSGLSLFQNGPRDSGLADPLQPFLAFGIEALDYDLDGDLDLIVGNGHVDPGVTGNVPGVTYLQRQQLFQNRGDGLFQEVERSGDLSIPRITRGLATGDFNNDGKVDMLVSGPNSPLALFWNSEEGGNWIGIRVVGTHCNRDSVGAWVDVTSDGLSQVRTIRRGSSYASASDVRVVFGMGSVSSAQITVTWPCGKSTTYRNVAAGRYYEAVKGQLGYR